MLEELKRRLPKNEHGNRRAKLWQLLTVDTGIPHLDRQITTVLTLMQISANKRDFELYFENVCGKQPKFAFAMPGKQIAGSVETKPSK